MDLFNSCSRHTVGDCFGSARPKYSIRTRVDGAVARCRQLGASHCRCSELHVYYSNKRVTFQTMFVGLDRSQLRKNQYDGEEEFWIVIRETGVRQEHQSYEETHEEVSKATLITSCTVGLEPIHCFVGLCSATGSQVLFFFTRLSMQASEKPEFNMGGEKFQGLTDMMNRAGAERSSDKTQPAQQSKHAQVGAW